MNKSAKLEVLREFYKSHGANFTFKEVETLQRIARQYQNNGVNLCNTPNYKDRREKLFDKLSKFLPSAGFGPSDVNEGGDPRGYCLTLIFPNGREISPERFN